MSVSYTCPNPDCGVTLKTPNPVPPGKRVKCPKCTQMFTPVPDGKSRRVSRGGSTVRTERTHSPMILGYLESK